MIRGGLVLVEGPRYFSAPNAALRKTFSVEELRVRARTAAAYQGIEGDLWLDEPDRSNADDESIFLPFDAIELAVDCLRADPNGQRRLLAVTMLPDHPPPLPRPFEFVGYDVGEVASRFNRFSCIFNELLFGPYPELASFAAQINAFGLFSEREHADEFVRARAGIRGLEKFEGGRPEVMEVWRFRNWVLR